MKFFWGTATSAYQIEGSTTADGRVPSIWDTFCRQPGTILNSSSGDTADDHYNRWQTDIALMKELGVNAYRFSIAWPRAISGKQGLAFYEKLVDTLLEAEIEPFVTLYHWDLPQFLQDQGGWVNRATCKAFAQYVQTAYEVLGDRIKYWITLNEPYIASIYGHLVGSHAPGIKNFKTAMAAAHHQLLAHGYAVKVLRQSKHKIGISLNLAPIIPENTESEEAAQYFDLIHDKFYLEALYKGNYPKEILKQMPWLNDLILPGDMQIISTPTDFLGINYYSPIEAETDPDNPFFGVKLSSGKKNPYSQLFDVNPQKMGELLESVWKTYHPPEIFITENGTCVEDTIGSDGKIHDFYRQEYLRMHIEEVLRAKHAGVPLSGYFVWSLLDNFEWTFGYQRRFGLVYVDFDTQKRTIKESGFWYKTFIQNQKSQDNQK